MYREANLALGDIIKVRAFKDLLPHPHKGGSSGPNALVAPHHISD